jgi:uroporphyrinogen-III synthase
VSSPLAGKRIVNTRALHQAGDLDVAIRSAGAVPISFPCIEIAPPTEVGPLNAALSDLITGSFDWLILTSTNTCQALATRLLMLGASIARDTHFLTAAIGATTAEAAQRLLGLTPDLVPAESSSEGLAAALPLLAGKRVLLPQSEIADPLLSIQLRSAGASVTAVAAYRTVTGAGGDDLSGMLDRNEVDAITFASSSAVRGLAERLGLDWQPTALRTSVVSACIGSKTAETAAALGFPNISIATEQSSAGLVAACTPNCVATSAPEGATV